MVTTNLILESVARFLAKADSEFFNEAELQHELGYWLRADLDSGAKIFFERPAASFFPGAVGLIKKEIDLVVTPFNQAWYFAIELKCPRNGRFPETMFDACKDLQLLEQLTTFGFCGGLFVMHVNDSGYYRSGSHVGIYAHFRRGLPFPQTITKPTGKKDEIVTLKHGYKVDWQSYGEAGRYWLQLVPPGLG